MLGRVKEYLENSSILVELMKKTIAGSEESDCSSKAKLESLKNKIAHKKQEVKKLESNFSLLQDQDNSSFIQSCENISRLLNRGVEELSELENIELQEKKRQKILARPAFSWVTETRNT